MRGGEPSSAPSRCPCKQEGWAQERRVEGVGGGLLYVIGLRQHLLFLFFLLLFLSILSFFRQFFLLRITSTQLDTMYTFHVDHKDRKENADYNKMWIETNWSLTAIRNHQHPVAGTPKMLCPAILFFNPLNTKRRPLYLKGHFIQRSKHFSSRL